MIVIGEIMKIKACPSCGSKNIFAGTMESGITFGITSWKEMCRDCGYQGQSITFDSEEDYKKFLEEIKQKPQEKEAQLKEEYSIEDQVDEVLKITKKDKEVVNLLKEYEKETVDKPIWPKNKGWWPEIGLAIVLAVFVNLSEISDIITMMGVGTAAVYALLNFMGSFVILLLIIIIVEYVLRYVKNTIVK